MKRQIENLTGSPRQSKRYLPALMLLSALFLLSCKSQQPVLTGTTTTRNEKELVRDTSVTVAPQDSASIKALFTCDSLNNALLKELSEKEGQRIKPSINLTKKEDGSIEVEFQCKEDSLQTEIEIREKIIEEQREIIQTLEVEKELTGWQKFIQAMGYVFLGVIVFGLIFTIIKFAV